MDGAASSVNPASLVQEAAVTEKRPNTRGISRDEDPQPTLDENLPTLEENLHEKAKVQADIVAEKAKKRLSKAQRLTKVYLSAKEKQQKFDSLQCFIGVWRSACQRHRNYKRMKEEERLILETAFEIHDRNADGLLSLQETRFFIAEIGLAGITDAERREECQLCSLAVSLVNDHVLATFESGPSETGLLDKFDVAQTGLFDIFDVALWILPRLRHIYQDLCFEELQRRMITSSQDSRNGPTFNICVDVARQFGIPQHRLHEVIEEAKHHWQEAGPTPCRKSIRFSPPSESTKPTIDTSLAAKAITETRERLALSLRQAERDAQAEHHIDEVDFEITRSHLIDYSDRFDSVRVPEWSCITAEQTRSVLMDLGVQPQNPRARFIFERDLASLINTRNKFMNLKSVLRFVIAQRESQKRYRADELALCFRLFEREQIGSMSLAEASQALSYFNIIPRNKIEQDALIKLYREADTNGNGRITRPWFRLLWIRAHEELQALQYQAGYAIALTQGFTDPEIQKLWEAFGELDGDDQMEKLSCFSRVSVEPRRSQIPAQICSNFDLPLDSEDEEECMRGGRTISKLQPTAQDSANAAVDFRAFVRMWDPPVRSHEEECVRPRLLARSWTAWDLRRALNLTHLPKDYVRTLRSTQDLTSALVQVFEVSCPDEREPIVSVAEHIGAKMTTDLFRAAHSLVFASEISSEKRLSRERIANHFANHFGL